MPRALISVSDKTGLAEVARALVTHGYEILSTGGTARALREACIDVIDVSRITGFPEIMDGRVKTLHPAVHAGILADRDKPAHMDQLRSQGFAPIDVVIINLYPFVETIDAGCTYPEAVEQIDIGGPAMVRAAAKNHAHVAIVTHWSQYPRLLEDLRAGGGKTSPSVRALLAADAFALTSEYDAAVAEYLADHAGRDAGDADRPDSPWPELISLDFVLATALRYGENPHQAAAVYLDPASPGVSLADARQLHGKELSYNNLADAAAALMVADELAKLEPGLTAAVVVKHTNPCGAAVAGSAVDAVRAAYAGDPVAAYGGILALSRPVDAACARFLAEGEKFFEVIIAPEYEPDALALLAARWKNVRLLEAPEWGEEHIAEEVSIKLIPGGALVQERDAQGADIGMWKTVAGPPVEGSRIRAAAVVWTIAKHLTSNAIAIGGADGEFGGAVRLFGAGAGQVDRVSACRIAVEKAGDHASGAIAASDAFFPFDDGPRVLIDAGVVCLVHPGGSKRDEDTVRLCESRGVTCITTGVRHFRH